MEDLIISVGQRAIIAAIPLLFATLGEIITERAGIMNLGVEGMMALGAMSAFLTAFTTGNPYLAIPVAMVVTAVFSLLHGLVSIQFRANQVVSGLALSMLGVGISAMWGKPYIGKSLSEPLRNISIPLLSDIPIIGPILFEQNILFYLAIVLGVAAWFILKHTLLGVYVRSVGENPKAAQAQGVPVFIIQYAAIAVGGAFAGLAGAQLSLFYSTTWIEGVTGGRGWIAIALTIFALWNPLRAFTGAFLFGAIFVLQYILQPLKISPSLLAMLPYVTTLLVLFIDGVRKDHRNLHAPAMLGETYRPGER